MLLGDIVKQTIQLLGSYLKYIPLVKRIIRASIHKSTGYSPTELVYAGMIDTKHYGRQKYHI